MGPGGVSSRLCCCGAPVLEVKHCCCLCTHYNTLAERPVHQQSALAVQQGHAVARQHASPEMRLGGPSGRTCSPADTGTRQTSDVAVEEGGGDSADDRTEEICEDVLSPVG